MISKKAFISFLVLSVSLSCCSSKLNVNLAKPTYDVLDNSSRENKRPAYVFGELESKWEKDKEYEYFIGEDDNTVKTLCMKGAQVDATEKVVKQLSQEMNSNFEKSVKNENDNVQTSTSMNTMDKIYSKIGGIKNVANYWELRQYKKELGAEQNKKLYTCYSVVKISKATLNEVSDSVTSAQIRANDNNR